MSTNPNDDILRKISGSRNRKAPAPNGDPSGPLEPDEARALGKHFAKEAAKEKRRPIVPMGPDGAGKTSLYASLFRARTALDVRFNAESSMFPRESPVGAEIIAAGERIMGSDVPNFQDQAVEATRFAVPFFMPLELRPRRPGLPPAKLAYLESRGEFYKPSTGQDPDSGRAFRIRKPLPLVVAEFLRCFEGPITFIHVAPCDDTCGDKRPADDAILFGLENYQRVRGEAHSAQDSHLFLLNKWDRPARQIGLDAYLTPSRDAVKKVLRREFRESWRKFQGMRAGASDVSHSYMQYIGTANGDDHYPKTVLNWLYKGINGRDLFPEVVPPPAPGWMDTLRYFVGM